MDNLLFKIKLEQEKNANVYFIQPNQNTLGESIYYNKYGIIDKSYMDHYKVAYPQYYEYKINNSPDITLYKPISPHFYRKVIAMYTEIFGNNVYIVSTDDDDLEAILYLTLNKNVNITHNILNDGNRQEHISKMYDRHNIYKNIYGDIFKTDSKKPSDIHEPNVYNSNTIQKFIDTREKISLFIYCHRSLFGFLKFKINELQHFYYFIAALNTLALKGSYKFRYNGYSKNYMYQILYILAKYFDEIKLTKLKLSVSMEFEICCINYKEKITKEDNKTLLDILDEWSKLNPNGGWNLNYSDEKLRKKYNIKEEFDKKEHYDTFVTNIIDIKSTYPEKSKKIYEKLFTKIDKHYKKVDDRKKKLANKVKHITDDILIHRYKKTYMNSLTASIELLKRYDILIKPEYEKQIIDYSNQVIFDSITIPKIIVVQMFDYDIVCSNDIKSITNKYFDKNKDKEKDDKVPFRFGNMKVNSRLVERTAIIANDNNCNNTFKFEPQKYNYKKNTYDISKYSFEKYKDLLNLYKLNIDSIGPEKWMNVAKITNISQGVIFYIKNKFNIDVTRGFVKMYEMCNEFNLIDFTKDSVKTFHTCEAPGHFINATNHYVKSNKPSMKFDWHANSLNPFNPDTIKKFGKSMFKDQYGYMKKYKEKWLYGKDNTGNIMDSQNIKSFKEKFNYSVDLFTSDCGIESATKKDYMNQEIRNNKLCFSQVLIALSTVKLGGHGLLKIFSPFGNSSTLSFIFLLHKHFEFVYFVKQMTGGPENNEVYIVFKNKLQHLDPELEKYLFNCLDNFDENLALFPLEIYNPYFIQQMQKINKKFISKQIKNLVRTFYYCDSNDKLKEHTQLLTSAKLSYSKTWVSNMNFTNIDKNLEL